MNVTFKNIINIGIVFSLVFVCLYFSDKDPKYKHQEIACTKISKDLEKYNCWEKSLNGTLEKNGLEASFDLVAKIYKTDPEFEEYCHTLAHGLGKNAYNMFLESKNFELTPKASYCGYGFYHGLMENLLLTESGEKEVSRFCNDAYKQGSSLGGACYHGTGHGAETMTILDSNVWGNPKEMFDRALAICEAVSFGDMDKYSNCATGVFMEAADYFIKGKYDLKFDKRFPYKICNEIDETAKLSCYTQQYPILSGITNTDFSKAVRFIEEIKEDKYATKAMETLAGSMVEVNGGRNEKEVAICRRVETRLHESCIRGLALGYLLNSDPGNEFTYAKKLCMENGMDESEKKSCFDMALNQAHGISTSIQVMDFCLETPVEYRNKICAI